MGDQDIATELMLAEASIARLSESAIRDALEGFPLQPIQPLLWISRGVQGAVYHARLFGNSPTRLSNSDVRDELLGLAEAISSTAERLKNLSDEADSAAWQTAIGQALDRLGTPSRNVLVGTPPAYAAIAKAHSKLVEVGDLFTSTAKRMALSSQNQKWRQREGHEARVAFAFYLSPVFEQGFGKTPAPNNWERSDGQPRLGYWPDFYQRIAALVFGERATPNLLRILKQARQLSKESGGLFPSNLLPE